MQLIKIPKASENLEAATVGRWLKDEGDTVAPGDEVVEILTDKADFTIEAEEEGVLRKTTVAEKSTVPVGYIIAVIAAADEQLPDVESENRTLQESAAPRAAPQPQAQPAKRPKKNFTGKKTPATPAARRLARENNVELADVADALGKKGVISGEDVQEYLNRR